MKIRAKFQLQEIHEMLHTDAKNLVFRVMYDNTIPEDQRFFDATPWGEFKMLVNNPEALKNFKIGKFYYVDFTPTDE